MCPIKQYMRFYCNMYYVLFDLCIFVYVLRVHYWAAALRCESKFYYMETRLALDLGGDRFILDH